MANKHLTQILSLLMGAFLVTQTAYATTSGLNPELQEKALKQSQQAVKLNTAFDPRFFLDSMLPKNLPADAIKKSPLKSGMRAIVGGINFTASDVDNTMIPFATKNGPGFTYLFHDGGEWNTGTDSHYSDDGSGSGESQAQEIYDYDGNGRYPKACLRYIGAHCYIFVPVMFFPTLPKTLSSSEADTPKAYGEWNMHWSHDASLYYSPDAVGQRVLEPRYILGADKAAAKMTLAKIADEFDNVIYPKMREYLGSEPDVDGDPKIFIFLDDIRDTNGSTQGYFDRANELTRSSHTYSNEKEIIFLDIFSLYNNRTYALSTLAHEFCHMIIFAGAWSVVDNQLKGLQTWVEEGITSYMQHIYSGSFPANLDLFIRNPDTILVEDRSSVWSGMSPYANYGASFLWTYYVAEKYGYASVPTFLKAIIGAKVDGGVGNYDSFFKAFNTTMQTVFRDWVVANFVDKVYRNDGVTLLNEGKWGYKVDADKNTANDVKYTQGLPMPATENFVLSAEMNTRSGTVNSWAGDCIALTGNTGNLNLGFDGNTNAKFECAVVKMGRSVETDVEYMVLNDKQVGNLIVQNYGTTGAYETVLLIPMVTQNYNYQKLSYVYSGSFDDLKVAIFPNPLFENYLHIIVKTEKEFASEPRVQMTYEGEQGYLTMSPINASTYMANYTLKTSGSGSLVCSGTNKNGVILSNTLNFSAIYYPKGSSGILTANFAALDIPEGAMSGAGVVVLSSTDSSTSYQGVARMSRNVDVALPVEQTDKPIAITIPISTDAKFNEKKAGLYRATSAGQKYVGPVTVADGKAKGNIDVSASVFVAADETAPVISNDTEIRGNGRFAVKVSDVGSGVNASSVKVACEGIPVIAALSGDSIVVDTTRMNAASQVFDVEVADNAGNITRASIRGFAGATSLEQVVAYPNPARKGYSIIRATFTGTDKALAGGSVKIYDMAGHKVIEGNMTNDGTGVCEFYWDHHNKKNKLVANGTYFADVKVSINGDTHKERIKLAVLR